MVGQNLSVVHDHGTNNRTRFFPRPPKYKKPGCSGFLGTGCGAVVIDTVLVFYFHHGDNSLKIRPQSKGLDIFTFLNVNCKWQLIRDDSWGLTWCSSSVYLTHRMSCMHYFQSGGCCKRLCCLLICFTAHVNQTYSYCFCTDKYLRHVMTSGSWLFLRFRWELAACATPPPLWWVD